MGNQFLLSLAVALSVASTASATFISPFSTESLSWSTPSNLTINQFDAKHPLLLPLQESIILRVFSSPSCAAIDSDPARKMWWAEVRRHVAHENALALGNVAVSDLPRGLDAAMFGLVDAAQCSGIAYLPFGFDGTGPRPEQKHVAPPDSHGMPAFVAWASSSLRTFCTVTNLLDRDLTLFWVDDSLDLKKLTQVGAGESVPQNTFVGHAYVAKDASTLAVVDWWAMDGSPSHVISDKAALLAHSCQAPVAAGAKEMAKELKLGEDSGHGGCASGKPFDPEQSLFDFLYDSSMVKRYALNTVQPTVVHNYSATGYAVLPLPPHTYEWLRKWYHDNAAREIVEGSAGAVGTQHKAPWYVRHISHHLKQRLITELRPMLAEWSGYEDDALEMTSIYGVRRYSRGSVLRMHVDTLMSHVVSAIVNVDQVGVEKDWPLEIKSHDGQYHYVNMKPGEILLYESAKCLHGRPQPFEGDSYANIFLHFRPTAPGLWEYGWY